MTTWNTIPQKPHWQYDSDPPDPGAGTNGIRTTTNGQKIYTHVQHRILHAGRASRPSEISKGFWDANGTLLPESSIRTAGLSSVSGLNITWDSDNRGIRIIKTSLTTTNNQAFLFYSGHTMIEDNGGNYGAGKYKVFFDVTQNSGDIETGHTNSPTNTALFLSFRDDDTVVETPQSENKDFLAITKGFNLFDIELFDDNDARPPAICLVIHRGTTGGTPSNVAYDITISDIHVVHVG